jgi:hypothetical protein
MPVAKSITFLNNNTITSILTEDDANLSVTLMIPVEKLKVMNVLHNLYLILTTNTLNTWQL